MNAALLDVLSVADVLALIAALAATRPSLLPRSTASQLLAVAVAVLLAYLAGAVLRPVVVEAVPGLQLHPTAVPLVWAVGGALVAWSATRAHGTTARLLRPLVGVGLLVAVVGAVDAGLRVAVQVDDAVTTSLGPAAAQGYRSLLVLVVALLAGQRLWRHATDFRALALAYDRDPPTALPLAASVLGCLAAAAGARVLHSSLTGRLQDRLGRDDWLPGAAAALVMVVVLLALLALGVSVLRWWLLRTDLVPDARFATADGLPEQVSGHAGSPGRSDGSAVAFTSLGRAGQEFVHTRLAAAEPGGLTPRLSRQRDEPATAQRAGHAREPIRIYVGTRSADRWRPLPKLNARVDLAMTELTRTKALDREVVLVVVPTGSGWVSPTVVEALEQLTGGNCATVVVQYAVFPSWLAVLLAGRATELQTRLLHRLVERLEARPPSARPKTLVFGESLGALVGHRALDRVAAARGQRAAALVGAALWVGAPDQARRVEAARRVGAGAVLTPASTAADDLRDVAGARHVFLSHPDDPVARFSLRSLIEPLPGLALGRAARATRTYRPAHPDSVQRLSPWRPGVMFARLLADVMAPSSVTKGLAVTAGHEYGRDLPRLLGAALDRPVDDDLVQALMAHRARIEYGPAADPVPKQRQAAAEPRPDVTELRVHGVGGAPPEHALNHPLAYQVAGDSTAGFYRCGSFEDRPLPPALRRREAYSWGGLTSGAWSRALWVLLLPFTMVNVSHWMAPRSPSGVATPRFVHLSQLLAALHRLLALAMTASIVLVVCGVGMVAVGWQCSTPEDCRGSKPALVNDLSVPFVGSFDVPLPTSSGPRAVLTVVPALLALAGLRALSTASRQRYERWQLPPRRAEDDAARAGLAARDFWRGHVPVERLQQLHTTAALALVTVVLVYPAYRARSTTQFAAVLGVVLVVAGVLLAIAVYETSRPSVVGRPGNVPVQARPAEPDVDPGGSLSVALQVTTVGALVLLGVAALVVAMSWRSPTPSTTPGEVDFLPGYGALLEGSFWAQGGLLVLLLAALAPTSTPLRSLLRRRGPAPGDADRAAPSGPSLAGPRAEAQQGYTPMAWGFAPFIVTALASLVGAGLSAGLLLMTARLTSSSDLGDGAGQLRLPVGVQQGAVALVFAIVCFLLALGVLLLGRLLTAGRMVNEIQAEYGRGSSHRRPDGTREQPWVARRRVQIARSRANGWLVDRSFRPAAAAVAGGALGMALSLRDDLRPHFVEPCLWLVGAMTAWVLGYTYSALRDRERRRFVGVLWDVCTFWPRAAHPFAAPCYCERAVPDLVCRIEALTRPLDGATFPYPSSGVVLVGYSQGSLIAAAAVAQLDGSSGAGLCAEPPEGSADPLDRLALLTCASPLRRLYARCFPAYFPLSVLREDEAQRAAGDGLSDGKAAAPAAVRTGDGADGTTAVLGALADRGLWRNVYRPTDFIGSWVVHPPSVDGRGTARSSDGHVDKPIPDPASFDPPLGDLALPRILAHGGYLADPHLLDEVDDITVQLRTHVGLPERPRTP